MGNAVYEERRKLEAENKLLHEQKFNQRLKREVTADEVVDLIHAAVKAFLSGYGKIVITPVTNSLGTVTEIRFSTKPDSE